jgi:PPOX class probable F420-dependent enzyme
MIDFTTEFGVRTAQSLQEEFVIWLVTVSPTLEPQPSPVWFLWEQDALLLYSQPDKPKLRHIAHHPAVALHLNCDRYGQQVVVLSGQAQIEDTAPAADQMPAYLAKYRDQISAIGMTPASFAASFRVPVRVRLTGLRGH